MRVNDIREWLANCIFDWKQPFGLGKQFSGSTDFVGEDDFHFLKWRLNFQYYSVLPYFHIMFHFILLSDSKSDCIKRTNIGKIEIKFSIYSVFHWSYNLKTCTKLLSEIVFQFHEIFLKINWKLKLISFQFSRQQTFHSKFDVSRVEWQKTSTHQTYISELHPAPLSYEEWSVLAEKEDKTFPKEPKTLQSRIWQKKWFI